MELITVIKHMILRDNVGEFLRIHGNKNRQIKIGDAQWMMGINQLEISFMKKP